MIHKVFESKEGNVWKYVFDSGDVCYEAVLYRYEDFYKRTVICCSVQCGCPVGCTFCGTGEQFVRNLTADEIVSQVEYILADKGMSDINDKVKRFQIMFMSMGEPMLNWDNVSRAIDILHAKYPIAELLISTIGINAGRRTYFNLLEKSYDINKIGLQFSMHKSIDSERDKLIPYENKFTLKQIAGLGKEWKLQTGRKPYLNYCIDGTNNTDKDFENIKALFSPDIFCMTFSVICSKDCNSFEGFRDIEAIRAFEYKFLNAGYDTRVFNPAGQDDIGGGCGMLWYVQEWFDKRKAR